MSVACALLAKMAGAEQWWFGAAIPFLGPGVLAYLFGASFGESLYQTSSRFADAVAIGAAALAYERKRVEYWQALSWRELELRVAALFGRLGYSARATPRSNDRGVDVVAEKLNEKIVIQCKQYSKPAQRSVVSELLGVLTAENADRAILVCTGGFTRGAEEYARQHRIELWQANDLARLSDETEAG